MVNTLPTADMFMTRKSASNFDMETPRHKYRHGPIKILFLLLIKRVNPRLRKRLLGIRMICQRWNLSGAGLRMNKMTCELCSDTHEHSPIIYLLAQHLQVTHQNSYTYSPRCCASTYVLKMRCLLQLL